MAERIDPSTAPITLLHKHRPCPQCGGGRVTVRKELARGGEPVWIVACSDCSFRREVADLAPDQM